MKIHELYKQNISGNFIKKEVLIEKLNMINSFYNCLDEIFKDVEILRNDVCHFVVIKKNIDDVLIYHDLNKNKITIDNKYVLREINKINFESFLKYAEKQHFDYKLRKNLKEIKLVLINWYFKKTFGIKKDFNIDVHANFELNKSFTNITTAQEYLSLIKTNTFYENVTK